MATFECEVDLDLSEYYESIIALDEDRATKKVKDKMIKDLKKTDPDELTKCMKKHEFEGE